MIQPGLSLLLCLCANGWLCLDLSESNLDVRVRAGQPLGVDWSRRHQTQIVTTDTGAVHIWRASIIIAQIEMYHTLSSYLRESRCPPPHPAPSRRSWGSCCWGGPGWWSAGWRGRWWGPPSWSLRPLPSFSNVNFLLPFHCCSTFQEI